MRYYCDTYRGFLLLDSGTHTKIYDAEPTRYIPLTEQAYLQMKADRERRRARFMTLHRKFRGRVVHVLGNGPSARKFRRRPDDAVIGVNACGLIVDPDVLIIMDRFNDDTRDLNKYLLKYVKSRPEGTMILTTPQVEVQHLVNPALEGWGPDGVFDHTRGPDQNMAYGLFSVQSTVHAALDLARHTEPAEIRIWGVDYNDRSHFYTGGTDIPADTNDKPWGSWEKWLNHLDAFVQMKHYMDLRKLKCVNMSPTSRLELWPKESPDGVRADNRPDAEPAIAVQKPPLIYVYGTEATPYEKEALDCVERFSKFGVKITPNLIPNQADWMKNCMARSQDLDVAANKVWSLYPQTIVGLIDSDLYPEKDPSAFLTVPDGYDCTMHYRPDHPKAHDKCQASIVLFAPTEKGMKMLSEWARLCREDQTPRKVLREQVYLLKAVETVQPRVFDVGLACNCRPEERREVTEVIIEHRPASRQYLKVIGGKR